MIIFDTCVWVSVIDENDINHEKAVKTLCQVDIPDILLLDQIYLETLTVLRYKVSEEACKQFQLLINTYNLSLINSFDDFENITSLFLEKRKLSFVDTTLLFWNQKKGCIVITFDKSLKKLLKSE